MNKITLVVCSILFLGCANMTFNAAMCDQIASEPNAVIPKECRNYLEEEAQKAFDNTKHKREQSADDTIEFKKSNLAQ
jgi:hypothetical protein